jgi:hypothetical protein
MHDVVDMLARDTELLGYHPGTAPVLILLPYLSDLLNGQLRLHARKFFLPQTEMICLPGFILASLLIRTSRYGGRIPGRTLAATCRLYRADNKRFARTPGKTIAKCPACSSPSSRFAWFPACSLGFSLARREGRLNHCQSFAHHVQPTRRQFLKSALGSIHRHANGGFIAAIRKADAQLD